MFRFTLLFLLPLLLSVNAQNGFGTNVRRPRPLPTLGRPRPVRPAAVVTQPPVPSVTPPPAVVVTLPPAVASTQPPQAVSAPQVIIQLVTGNQPPAVQSPPAVAQPVIVPAPIPSPPATAVPTVPIEAKEELAELYPEPEPEPLPQPEPEVEPQPESEPEPEPEPLPVPEPEPLQNLKPQLNYVSVPTVVSKPVALKPVALPPLLPKPQPVRDPIFGRQTPPPPTTQYPIIISTQRVTKAPPVVVTSQKPGFLKLDLICKDRNGYYAVENECDSYIECKYNQATQHWCPDGLHFNPAAKRFEYPCAYPSLVQCTAGKERQNPNPTAQCPRQYGFYSTNDGDCSKYVVCQEGLATLMDCPSGLVFNPTLQSCDYVENVPQCNPNVFKEYVCPEAPIDENGLVTDIIYKYRYEQHCKLYVACQRGFPRLLSCDHGLSFDEGSQSCVDEEYVQNCAAPYTAPYSAPYAY